MADFAPSEFFRARFKPAGAVRPVMWTVKVTGRRNGLVTMLRFRDNGDDFSRERADGSFEERLTVIVATEREVRLTPLRWNLTHATLEAAGDRR